MSAPPFRYERLVVARFSATTVSNKSTRRSDNRGHASSRITIPNGAVAELNSVTHRGHRTCVPSSEITLT